MKETEFDDMKEELQHEIKQLGEEIKHLKEANEITNIEFAKLADKEHEYLSEIRQLKETIIAIVEDDIWPQYYQEWLEERNLEDLITVDEINKYSLQKKVNI